MNVRDALSVVRSAWWVILIGTVVGGVLAGSLSWASTPLFSSSARLFLSTAVTSDSSAAYQGGLFSAQRATSYAELLTGEQLASVVVDDLNLDLSARTVADMVSARPLPDTVILEISVTDTSATRARDIAVALSEAFIDEVAELETPAGSVDPTVRVFTVEPPGLSLEPVSPQTPRNMTLGLLLGLLVGLGWVFLRSRLDDTVKSRDHVQESSGARLLGAVPEDPRLRDRFVLAAPDRHVGTGEAFRVIRTNVQFLDAANPPRVIVVTSARPDEGKSTVAALLSVALSQAGIGTVLVEADLRQQGARHNADAQGFPGLSQVLAGTATLRDALQPGRDRELAVLHAGELPSNPSEMLGSPAMRSLLETLRREYEFVIVDSPPLLQVTDAAVLTGLADGCLITTRFGSTRREDLAEATAVLDLIDARLVGVVLNRVPKSAPVLRGHGYADGLSVASDHGLGHSKRHRRGARGGNALPGRATSTTMFRDGDE